MDTKKVIVIGLGEVGSSWYKVLAGNPHVNLEGIDPRGNKERKNHDSHLDVSTVLHICLPYFNDFEKISADYINHYNPDLVVVNTSARVGTTRNLAELTKVNAVHIPVRGLHPNIDIGIKTFMNAIGPVNDLSARLAEGHLDSYGIIHETFGSSEETEMAKLLDTSYYGWNILFAKQVYDLCQEKGLDFENVYTRFNQTYNEGYTKLGRLNVIRPVLIPPQVFNKQIGVKDNHVNGHCVTCNLEILKTIEKSDKIKFIDYALDLNERG